LKSTTIHWHGLDHFGSCWFDGVPGHTQCPITPGDMFTYTFLAYPPGSMWYVRVSVRVKFRVRVRVSVRVKVRVKFSVLVRVS